MRVILLCILFIILVFFITNINNYGSFKAGAFGLKDFIETGETNPS